MVWQFIGKVWTGRLSYVVAASALLLTQNFGVALAYRLTGSHLILGQGFWLMPLRRLAQMPGLTPAIAAAGFIVSLGVAWALARLSFSRASRSRGVYPLAAFTVVPSFQVLAVLLIALTPLRPREAAHDPASGTGILHIVQGVLAGVAIIVFAVVISAIGFGSYGWGLFVLTPFLVGLITAYLANREHPLGPGQTLPLVMIAAGLGTLALVMLALEGFICILLAAPLGALAAAAGGSLGRSIALARQRRNQPLMSIALLPLVFALEAVFPPAISIATQQGVEIAAPPAAVWGALTSDDPIASSPGLIGKAGFAYPIRGRLLDRQLGAIRLGEFSTGIARELVTDWTPDRRLAFAVISQPAVMDEISPYHTVNAPHLKGYFETKGMSFDLTPLPGGHTLLTAHTTHVLRIDPALYWVPLARWAVHQNLARVLDDIKGKAENRADTAKSAADFAILLFGAGKSPAGEALHVQSPNKRVISRGIVARSGG